MAHHRNAARQVRAQLGELKTSLAGFHRQNLVLFKGSQRAVTKSRDILHSTERLPGMPGAHDRDSSDTSDFDVWGGSGLPVRRRG